MSDRESDPVVLWDLAKVLERGGEPYGWIPNRLREIAESLVVAPHELHILVGGRITAGTNRPRTAGNRFNYSRKRMRKSSEPFYVVLPAAKLAVASGGGTMIDLFNGTTDRLLRVRSARVFADCIAAITGVPILFRLQRTTAVGTSGTAITPLAFDTGMEPANAVTCRSLPTGGATLGPTLGVINGNPDEAAESALAAAWSGILGELLPAVVRRGPGLVVRPTTGCAIVAEGSSLVANVWVVIVFTAEPLRLSS